MYTEPEIVSTSNLEIRAYVTFYFKGERMREYTGNNTTLKIFPNRAKSVQDRDQKLHQLRAELLRCLSSGVYPVLKEPVILPVVEVRPPSVKEVLDVVLKNKLSKKLSAHYKKDLTLIHKQFTEEFLTQSELTGFLTDLHATRIQEFLMRFSSSGTYYMKKRSDLSILLNAAFRSQRIRPITNEVETMRTKAVLHLPYTDEQAKNLFKYLSQHNPKLYICCLLTYSSWLRPHVEIRNLTGGQFKNQATEIHLAGSENKSGKVRVVYVPDYAQRGVASLLVDLEPEMNIFSRTLKPFNEDYFKTLWGRMRPTLLSEKLIVDRQTIYSFRHTAVIEVYKRTKDIYLLQKLLGHYSIEVTQKYLRGLGEVNITELKNAAPQL